VANIKAMNHSEVMKFVDCFVVIVIVTYGLGPCGSGTSEVQEDDLQTQQYIKKVFESEFKKWFYSDLCLSECVGTKEGSLETTLLVRFS
jgi:hypothetical protein